jgi:hypothetical protein
LLAYNISHLLLYTVTIYYAQNLGKMKSALVAAISFLSSTAVFITIVR